MTVMLITALRAAANLGVFTANASLTPPAMRALSMRTWPGAARRTSSASRSRSSRAA
jgi:hypothetical protein